tara:strand:- start:7344 stop:7790 length:447 start_codon:yes stop_codon:yes gene_type:complete
MTNIVNGNTVTTDIIEQIVDKFVYTDEQEQKAASNAVNNAIYSETDLDELSDIALSYAGVPEGEQPQAVSFKKDEGNDTFLASGLSHEMSDKNKDIIKAIATRNNVTVVKVEGIVWEDSEGGKNDAINITFADGSVAHIHEYDIEVQY